MSPDILNLIKVFAPAASSFALGILMTPILTHYLYKHKVWRKEGVKLASDGAPAPISNAIYADDKRNVPRMGGIVVWGSVLITTVLFWIFAQIDGDLMNKLNFLSRGQTWLPLFTMIIGGAVGLIDDFYVTRGKGSYVGGGLSLAKRLAVVILMGLVGAWWFYFKLDVSSVIVPFLGEFDIGLLFIPFFVAVMLAVYSGGIIDGIDGLSGGVFATIFASYGIIAFAQNQIDLAAFSLTMVGGLLAFLWFNIPPARFISSETGMMAMTMSLTVIVFLTRQVLILPVIGFLLVITTGSVIIQLLSKRFRGKKILIASPLHTHLIAIGWPGYKVTMRYWVVGIVLAIVGVIVALVG